VAHHYEPKTHYGYDHGDYGGHGHGHDDRDRDRDDGHDRSVRDRDHGDHGGRLNASVYGRSTIDAHVRMNSLNSTHWFQVGGGCWPAVGWEAEVAPSDSIESGRDEYGHSCGVH
jgi:hypothetical protein